LAFRIKLRHKPPGQWSNTTMIEAEQNAEAFETQQTLKQREERYRAVSELTSDFVWAATIDQEGKFKIDWATDSFQTVTGYTPIELEARGGWFTLLHPDHLSELTTGMGEVNSGKSSVGEFRIVRKDGQIRWLRFFSRPLMDEKGQMRGMLGASKDITEQQQALQEKRALENQLITAQKLESLGVLAGGLAHDFNNLLSVVLGNLSLAQPALRAAPIDPEILDGLQEAEKACLRAVSLTRQLLTFAKGGAPIRKIARLQEIIEDSARFMVSGSKVKAEFNFSPELWVAEVDSGQLSQVIQNLVINAVQATAESGRIYLKAENVKLHEQQNLPLPAGNYVRIVVQDEGSGISPENLSNIFDPFFTTKTQGSGLGLAVVYSIIRQHGGHIEVESQPGAGTQFSLYLPATIQPVSAQAVAARSSSSPLQKADVLIMDDDVSVRQTLQRLLVRLGCFVVVASDGAEAVHLYREALQTERPFKLVILDLTVPGHMGGEETIHQLLKLDAQAQVLVSTGYSEDPVTANYQKYGFKGIISKPYRLQELEQALNEVLN